MGYTHYWRATNKVSDKNYQKALRDIRTIVSAIVTETGNQVPKMLYSELLTDVVLSDAYGNEGGKPEWATNIRFNGLGKNSHETFFLPSKQKNLTDFDFCKTARKPYDIVVTACLAVLVEVPGISVSSDGDASDWKNGVMLAKMILNREVANPIENQ